MTDQDVIFKVVEDTKGVDLSSFCYFGWEGIGAFAFYKYACAYYDSARALYEKIQESKGDYSMVDGLGIAMCFAYRHYTELMIKHLYIKFVCNDETDYKRFLNIGHNLVELWNEAKPKLKDLNDRVGSPVSLSIIEHYIKQINAFDKESMGMRYPIDKKLTPMHPQTRLDLANLVARMEELYHALECLSDSLDHQLVCTNIPISEIEAFISKYKELKPNVLHILQDLKCYAKKDEEDSKCRIGSYRDFLTKDKDSSFTYLCQIPDDEVILCDALYYTGRDIDMSQLTLPKNAHEAGVDVIKSCILSLKRDGLTFGLPKNDNINIYGKTASAIIKEISKAMSVIDNM